MTSERPLGPQGAARAVGVAELTDDAAHRVGGGRSGVGDLARVVEQLAHLADDAERQSERRRQQIPDRLGSVVVGCSAAASIVSRSGIGGGSGVALEVEELEGELHAALAVGDRVVHLLDEGGSPTPQPLDDGELPQRPDPIERVGRDDGREIEQRPLVGRFGKGEASDVAIDVEVGVVDPGRRREVARHAAHDLAQPRDDHRGALHALAEQVEVGSAIEDADVRERRREVRVLLESPHQPFGVGHLPVVDDPAHGVDQRRSSRPTAAESGARVSAASSAAGDDAGHDVGGVVDAHVRTTGRHRCGDEADECGDRLTAYVVTSRAAAKVAELAWPDGNDDVRGRRTPRRSSPDVVGRVRRNSRFTPWFTTRLSSPIRTAKVTDLRSVPVGGCRGPG